MVEREITGIYFNLKRGSGFSVEFHLYRTVDRGSFGSDEDRIGLNNRFSNPDSGLAVYPVVAVTHILQVHLNEGVHPFQVRWLRWACFGSLFFLVAFSFRGGTVFFQKGENRLPFDSGGMYLEYRFPGTLAAFLLRRKLQVPCDAQIGDRVFILDDIDKTICAFELLRPFSKVQPAFDVNGGKGSRCFRGLESQIPDLQGIGCCELNAVILACPIDQQREV